jgi:hypothetical protein
MEPALAGYLSLRRSLRRGATAHRLQQQPGLELEVLSKR